MSWYQGQLPDWLSIYERPDRFTTDICVAWKGHRRHFEMSQGVPRAALLDAAWEVLFELRKAEEVARKLTK